MIGQAVNTAGGPGGWLEQEVTKEYQQIRQAVYEDPYKLCYSDSFSAAIELCSNEDFDEEAAYMIRFAGNRSNIVLGQLSAH